MSTYFLIVTTLGSLFLFYLALAAFCNQEALKIKPENHVSVGFKLLLCSIIYGSYAGYTIYKYLEEKNNQSHALVEEGEMNDVLIDRRER